MVICNRNFQPATSWVLVRKDVQHLPLESSKNQNFPERPQEPELDPGLFQCPNEGSVSAHEKHLSWKVWNACRKSHSGEANVPRQDGRRKSKDVTSHCAEASVQERAANTSQIVKGWALKQTKNAGRLSESEKGYLDEKFKIVRKQVTNRIQLR